MRRSFLLLGAFLSTAPARAAVEWAPILNAELFGGYSRFSGDRLEGPNGSLLFVPGVKFGDRLSVLPVLMADYRKARDVQELAGGGFLTYAQHTRAASLKTVWKVSSAWKLKATAGYKQEFIKETKDESWGEGLFDYKKPSAGLEAAWEGGSFLRGFSAGVDAYAIRFPNFQSLASKKFGAEVAGGKDVLDYEAFDLPLTAQLGLAGGILDLKTLASLRRFPDQKVVGDSGAATGEVRRDVYGQLSADFRRPLPKLGPLESLVSFSGAHGRLSSSQNNYDVAATQFNPDYYSYGETSGGPSVLARFFGRLTASAGYSVVYRAYTDRPALTAAGAPTGGPIHTRAHTWRWSLSYPLMKGLSARLQGASQHQDSNMGWEEVYRYNYTSSNYFFGIGWEI